MGNSVIQYIIQHSPIIYLTQSIWRDEAFSILVAERPLSFFIGKLTFEPPLYYVLLHFWMKLFGNSEIAARSLSTLGFCLATVVMILWAERLFKKHWLNIFLPIFFFLNPMLLYYAFEIRTYGWYTFFTTLTLFAYWERKWPVFILGLVAGFYTHSFFLILPLSLMVHYFITHKDLIYPKLRLIKILNDTFVKANIILALCISPWLYLILQQASRLKESWYFPVDFQLIKSVLGNMFIGYEGTPWFLWRYTTIISVIFLLLFVLSLKSPKTRNRNLLFFIVIFVPLIVTIGISFIKPLFVNRYVLPVTIGEIILLALSIEAIQNAKIQKLVAAGLLLFVIGVNIWYPGQHLKLNIRQTVKEINMVKKPQDMILVETPLLLFETIYYSDNRDIVRLYNPNNSPFPWYIGDAIFSPSQMVKDFPEFPLRAFFIHNDGTFSIQYHHTISGQTNSQKPAVK